MKQIRILVVDDSSRKRSRVAQLVQRILPTDGVRLDEADSALVAIDLLQGARYDLLVLDINLPLRPGEPARRDGGVEVLRAVKSRKEVIRPQHILGLTGYRDLADQFAPEFAGEMWYLVEYSDSTDEWEQRVARKLIHVADAALEVPSRGHFGADLCILTALHRVELEAVLSLKADWLRKTFEGDDAIYYECEFVRDDAVLKVAAAAAFEMGMPATVAQAMKLIQHYRPRYIAMVGIAAGIKGAFGDILVADQAWDYGSGKHLFVDGRGSQFLPAPSHIPVSPHLKARLEAFALDRSIPRKIQLGWREAAQAPAVRIGPIASGAAVLASRPQIEEIVARQRNVIGVEMEVYGLFVAARQSLMPQPMALAIKSICDFGDATKDDAYQEYAAYTSASYLYEFALAELAERAPASQA